MENALETDERSAESPTERLGKKPDDQLKSLVKLVRVLDCFSLNDRSLTLAEISKRTGFPRSTAYRLLVSLRDVGFLEQDRGGDRYRLGLKLFELGNTALANFDLHREARPFIEALRQMTGQAVHLAVFDGHRAVVIRRAELAPDNAGGVSMNFVENAPAHCTSVGKAILAWQGRETIGRLIAQGLERFTVNTIVEGAQLQAELEHVRTRGYSVDDAEHQPGLRCIGAPIRNQRGMVFAGLSISGPAWKLPVENIEELSKVVMYHADRISNRLGHHA